MRRISHKRESKKPAQIEIEYLRDVRNCAIAPAACSYSECYNSIRHNHQQGFILLGGKLRLSLPKWRFCLTKAQLQQLYEQQGGLCALTGVPLLASRYSEPELNSVGLDFVRPNIGYIKNNCRLVCWPLAVGRAVRGRVPIYRHTRDHIYQNVYNRNEWETLYTQHNVQIRNLDTMPADNNVIRHSLMVLYLQHLHRYNLLKYYPIVVVLDAGTLIFKVYYYPVEPKQWRAEQHSRLQCVDFTRVVLNEQGDLVLGNPGNPNVIIDYVNPERDFCMEIDRAVITTLKIWYQRLVGTRY